MIYGPDEFQRDVSVSRETRKALETHLNLLRTWSGRMNLVGPGQLDDYWRRHALDSAQLLALAPDARLWLDLGSGAGFPGFVVACGLIGVSGARVDLVEANQKKAAFLRMAVLETGAPARVLPVRAERLAETRDKTGESYDIVTARAFAPLPLILTAAAPWLEAGAGGLFLKGEGVEAELAEAGKAWAMRTRTLPSLSDPRGRIVRVDGVQRA
ncbi:MAG: 16S rRNA (guanine(527)-N(7))-methyltransferase RsmG [Hyphomonadaceae bacterium]